MNDNLIDLVYTQLIHHTVDKFAILFSLKIQNNTNYARLIPIFRSKFDKYNKRRNNSFDYMLATKVILIAQTLVSVIKGFYQYRSNVIKSIYA